jgi:hypothetical protein
MATASTICQDALKEIGVLAEGDTPTATMIDDAFRALNRLMELYSNDGTFAYFASTVSQSLTGQASFTVGPTGDNIDDRPIKIDTATVDRDGITYPVTVIDNQKWDSIIYKANSGANTAYVYYEALMPNGVVHVWPVCTGVTLNIRVLNQVVSFATTATTLTMPPGYEELLIKSLAVNIAPQYPACTLSPLTVKAATSAYKKISKINNVIPTMAIDGNLTNKRGGSLAGFMGGYN